MPREFMLPDPGEGIHEAEIVQVLVKVGESVTEGQSILEIETDKATSEVPSPVTGIVKEVRVKPGDLVSVGDVVMVFTEEGESEEAEAALPEPEEEGREERAPKREQEKPQPRARVPTPEAKPPERKGPIPAAPSTRRVARELGVNLRQVSGTGSGGRVLTRDVREYAGKRKPPEARPEEPGPSEGRAEKARPTLPTELPDFSQWGPIERVPLRSIRRTIARRMSDAWSHIPHFSYQDIADITELEAFRQRHKDRIREQGGALTLTVFAMKAVVASLKKHPRFNASLDSEREEIILKHYYHIGIAVDTDRGLMVPVVRDVDRKSIAALSVELVELAERTRKGDLEREAMIGGTLNITNVGSLGGSGFAPIIDYPQVAILGLGQARYQPVVRGAPDRYEIIPRLMLPMVLACDHRLLDGADAARFLNEIKASFEDPEILMMSI